MAKAVNKEKAAKEHGGAAFSVMRGEIKPGQMREAVGKYGTRQDD